jgi:phosphatidylserine synthase
VAADVIDGPVAKRLSGRSADDRNFGANLDSLVDMVTVGAALGVVLLAYGEYGLAYLPGSFALLGAGALRLSYFNVHGLDDRTTSYVGLPADQAVMAFAAVMLLDVPLDRDVFQIVLYGFAIALAGAMVSQVRVPKPGRAGFVGLIAVAFAIAVLHAVRLVV